MRVLFVNPPSLGHDTSELAPPLWALTLGAIALQRECETSLLDLNLAIVEDPTLGNETLYPWVVDQIQRFDPHLVCFSSMAVNSHVCLEIARRIKYAVPARLIVVGGPHFGPAASDFLNYFPSVDAVVSGEGENAFSILIDSLRSSKALVNIIAPGLMIRGSRQIPVLTSSAVTTQPQSIPLPAYSLIDITRYFTANPFRLLDLDGASRGCRFRCRYCYSPIHLGQGGRSAGSARFLEEMGLASDLGGKNLFFVQDNFLNNPEETVALCHEIAASRFGLTFHCYATIAQLDGPTAEALANAGCLAVYVGVDAVHPEARRRFAKGLYRGRDDMLGRIEICLENGIEPTLAFLLEEPARGRDVLEETIATAAAGRMRGCPIRLNALSLYAGTASHAEYVGTFSPDPLQTRIALDVPEVVADNPLSFGVPHLFPFHSTHRDQQVQRSFLLGIDVLDVLIQTYAETMLELGERCLGWNLVEQILLSLDECDLIRFTAPERYRLYIEAFERLVRSAKI